MSLEDNTMSNNTNAHAAALAKLSKAELLGLLTTVLTAQVTQAPTPNFVADTKAAQEAKPKCGRIASSTGQPCTRNATTDEGSCKSHLGWDNDEALAKFAKGQDFVASRKAAKEGKGGVKVDNKALAAALRSVGRQANGDDWAAAKLLVNGGASVDDAALAVATA